MEKVAPVVDESAPITISVDNCVDSFDDFFKCLICFDIVQDPLQCAQSHCDKPYCTKCITSWLEQNPDCPNCKKRFIAADAMNRFALNTLKGYKFKCGTCHQGYTYETAGAHL